MALRWRQVRDDLRAGLATVRRGSKETVDRSLEEVEVLKLKFQVYKIEDQIKELYRAAGERGYQLIERGTPDMMGDPELKHIFEKLDLLKKDEERLRLAIEQVKE